MIKELYCLLFGHSKDDVRIYQIKEIFNDFIRHLIVCNRCNKIMKDKYISYFDRIKIREYLISKGITENQSMTIQQELEIINKFGKDYKHIVKEKK